MSIAYSAPGVQYHDIPIDVAKMSQTEQDAARDDLYGDRPLIRENEEMIQNSLQELDECIESIDSQKEAYETAQIICPEYANSREFRLIFLRCERFDATKAAQKIVHYWEKKVDVWGEDKAFRKITLDDFDDEDQTALTMGGFKILPNRDHAGRGIILSHRALWDSRTTHRNSMLRQLWYIVEAALEDVNVQRTGICFILYNGLPSYDHTKHDVKLVRKVVKILYRGLPIRIVATHHIMSSQVLKFVAEKLMYLIGLDGRARYRQHSGIKREYFESLAYHGIEPSVLPQALGGDIEFDYEQWLSDRRAQAR